VEDITCYITCTTGKPSGNRIWTSAIGSHNPPSKTCPNLSITDVPLLRSGQFPIHDHHEPITNGHHRTLVSRCEFPRVRQSLSNTLVSGLRLC
jgi:hypothetical protein